MNPSINTNRQTRQIQASLIKLIDTDCNTGAPQKAKHFTPLTEAQLERLSLLIEECGTIIRTATKILRHGYDTNSASLKSPLEAQAPARVQRCPAPRQSVAAN